MESLRNSIREHGAWPEDEAVKRLLHSLELTGGAAAGNQAPANVSDKLISAVGETFSD